MLSKKKAYILEQCSKLRVVPHPECTIWLLGAQILQKSVKTTKYRPLSQSRNILLANSVFTFAFAFSAFYVQPLTFEGGPSSKFDK